MTTHSTKNTQYVSKVRVKIWVRPKLLNIPKISRQLYGTITHLQRLTAKQNSHSEFSQHLLLDVLWMLHNDKHLTISLAFSNYRPLHTFDCLYNFVCTLQNIMCISVLNPALGLLYSNNVMWFTTANTVKIHYKELCFALQLTSGIGSWSPGIGQYK